MDQRDVRRRISSEENKKIDRSVRGEELRKSIMRIVENRLNKLKRIIKDNKSIKT